MAKNRIAYYTKEGKIHSVNVNFVNYSNTFPVNTLTNIFDNVIINAGTEGSKLYDIKLNNSIPFTSGTINVSAGSSFYFSLKHTYTNPLGGSPIITLLNTVEFNTTNALSALNKLISTWSDSILAQKDQRGNDYINLPPGTVLSLSCDVVATTTPASTTNYNLGKLNDSDPRAIKIIAYTEEY